MVLKGAVLSNKGQQLLELPIEVPLEVVVKAFCAENEILNGDKYSFKITANKNKEIEGSYLTEDNKPKLIDGYLLELVYSFEYLAQKIFQKLHLKNDIFFNLPMEHPERKKTFDDLYKLAIDPAFIKLVVKRGLLDNLLQIMALKQLSGKEASACLITLLHLLKIKAVNEIHYDPFVYIVSLATVDIGFDDIHLAYAVLSQMLYQKNANFKNPKESIIQKLSISKLLKRLREVRNNKELENNTLQLINAMVNAVQGEARTQLIKEMSMRSNREIIRECVLSKNDIRRNTAHELYVYQTYIMSTHKEALSFNVDPTLDSTYKELCECDVVPRSSTLLDFDSTAVMKRTTSQDTILSSDDYRISLASNKSVRTLKSQGSLYSDDFIEDRISCLAMNCLMHYKNNYEKHYYQSINEESIYDTTIFATADCITKMLAKIFRIGKEPDKSSQNYQPLVFNTEFKIDFFTELFSRTMWLLSKTRREMKACSHEDNQKVTKILKKQIEMILSKKPKCYTELDTIMKKTNYIAVAAALEKDYENDLKKMVDNNPSIQELKKQFILLNQKVIFQQKIKIMQHGHAFPKLPIEKKKEQYIKYELSSNKKLIYYYDWDNHLKKSLGPKKMFYISDIRHFLTGQACPHIKEGWVKKFTQAFSIILNTDTNFHFYAPDEKTANHWIDGFHLLLEKPNRSKNYERDLDILVDMDCRLQLMELQNIKIPTVPPQIPKLPTFLKPPIPPRPEKLLEIRTK